MAFTPKSWQNSPSTATPISAGALDDLEARVTNIGLGGITTQTGASYTAVAGDVVYANPSSGGITINLPTVAESTTVTVIAGSQITASNAVTISYSSAHILGPNLSSSGVTSFTLNTSLSSAQLTADNVWWYCVENPTGISGVSITPEQYGAVGDGITFLDGAVQGGSMTFTSASITAAVAASLNAAATASAPKHIYIPWAGAGTSAGTTSAGVTTGGPITSIPRTSGAVVTPGPIIISSGTHAQVFHVTSAGAALNGAIPVLSATPNFAFPSGSALSVHNAGLSTTISSASTGTATLAAAATQTVASCSMGWFGTDDAVAFQSAMTALANGGVLQCSAKMYILDGSLVQTNGQNTVVPLPVGSWGVPVMIEGTAAVSGGGIASPFSGAAFNATIFATTRIADAYDAVKGPPSLIGAATIEGGAGASFGPAVSLKDFTVLLPDNPAIGAIDLSQAGNSRIKGKVTVRTAGGMDGGPYGSNGQLNTNNYQFGLLLPVASNGGEVIVERFVASNCYIGLLTTEHSIILSALAFNCVGGLGVAGGVGHASAASYMDIEGCRFSICGWSAAGGIVAPSTAHSINAYIDIEDQTSAQWLPFYHVYDTNNVLSGRLTVFRWAGGSSDSLLISGCGNLLISMLHSQGQPRIAIFNSSTFSWTIPFAAQYLKITAVGGGGQGGGGGSVATGVGQAGGSGGGAGATSTQLVAVGNNTILGVAIGPGGSGAGAGGAAGANPGVAGADGSDTGVTGDGSGIAVYAKGGQGGSFGPATVNTTRAGGAKGGAGQPNTITAWAFGVPPGQGGGAYTGLSWGQGGAPDEFSGGGGGGGGSSNTTNGGGGGSAGTLDNAGGGPGGLGTSGTTAGQNGANAAANTGAGGGGGGGGTNNTGKGGNGGNGGNGYVLVEVIY